ncbi:MAG: peptidoglycan-binding protein [Cyanobacteriota bacterium]|nr:peptidoglycan-binding protein [Cyanobacteriota bacterium]
MKKIGSDYQDLAGETSLNNEVVPVKVDFKSITDIREKMSNNSRLALPWISVVTTLTILGSSSEVLALQRGDNNAQVKNVQSCLRRLGHFNGPVNGNFGSITEAAVKKFQRANGISDIGKVGPRTQAALQRRCGSRSRTVSANDCQRGLRSGCDGAEVRTLQRNLRRVGVYNGPVTGRFRELTKNAVIRFQRQQGINPIGIYGPQTQAAMRRALARAVNPPVSPPTTPTSRGRFCDFRTEVIRLGCRSEWVRQMQQRLKDLRYFQGTPTGYFGEITQRAVINFQRDNRLPATGTVGRRTWNAMNGFPMTTLPPTAPPPINTSILTVGSRGSQVTTLQQNLKQLNYFYGNPTGFYDKSTQDAVLRFQQSYGLPMTGNVDQRTSQAIFQVLRSRGGMGGGSDFEPIYPGENNQRVEKLQKRLLELGLLKANPTGYFGPFTREGLLAFQRYRGLSETGFVDEQTWEKLGFSSSREKRYVVVIPLQNPDTYNRILQYLPSARVGKSRLGDFVNAGEYNQRNEAQRQSQFLRQQGFDARVEYF